MTAIFYKEVNKEISCFTEYQTRPALTTTGKMKIRTILLWFVRDMKNNNPQEKRGITTPREKGLQLCTKAPH